MKISEIKEISLSDITIANSINVRSDLSSPNSKENLEELAANIEQNGLMQPIVLRGIEGHPPYDVVVGKRRFLAHQLLKVDTIKAVFTGQINDTEAIILSLSENMLRQEMNHVDIMKAVTSLYEEFGKDEKKVHQKTGLSIRTIRSYITVEAQATTKLKQLITERSISLSDAKRAIEASGGDTNKADILIDEIVKMTKHEKTRMRGDAQTNPNATVKEIVKNALTPKFEERLTLSLSFALANALKKAHEDLGLDKEIIGLDSLATWLKTNDFLIE
jgi:ParB family transcriptional regulator, chromosome partitioning protein